MIVDLKGIRSLEETESGAERQYVISLRVRDTERVHDFVVKVTDGDGIAVVASSAELAAFGGTSLTNLNPAFEAVRVLDAANGMRV